MTPAYYVAWSLSRYFGKFYLRWRLCNPERVPLTGPVILVANHASYADPPLVGSAIRRDFYFLAREDLFRNAVAGYLLRSINSVPVDREGHGAAGLKGILDRLRKGGGVVLFPEGTRTRDGSLQPARPGIGLVVLKSECPLIPARLFGTYEAYGRGVRFPKPRRIAIKYGRPLMFAQARAEARSCSRLRLRQIHEEIARDVMAAIGALEPWEDQETFPARR
jgi:1-acyl-sn-glycerol-3-phosphate acyltransferase